jgi:hypothetical protein
MGLADALIDENGNFLGRTVKSWAKILGFYAVYYSFLAVLFYGFTVTFYLESRVLSNSPVGGKPAIANPRLDMPGAVVHPFKELMDDGDINRFVMDKDFIEQKYCVQMNEFFDNKEKLNENSVDCSSDEHNSASGTCKVNTVITKNGDVFENLPKNFDFSTCKALTNIKKPMFAIDINKIIGWTPNAVGIHFDCYEYEKMSAEKLETQTFEFKWLSSSSIPSYYYPFNGVSKEQLVKLPIDNRGPKGDRVEPCDTKKCEDNKPYNKPFVGGIISGDFKKGEEHFFRCDILSDKINRQFDDNSPDTEALNADLRKLGIGFVEFGYKFDF